MPQNLVATYDQKFVEKTQKPGKPVEKNFRGKAGGKEFQKSESRKQLGALSLSAFRCFKAFFTGFPLPYRGFVIRPKVPILLSFWLAPEFPV